MLPLHLQPESHIPLYVQLRDQLRALVHSGELRTGDRIPASRELAGQLGVHRTTVANAYAELESEGLIQGHVGRGTFICGAPVKQFSPPPRTNGNGGAMRWEALFADERGEESLSRLMPDVPAGAIAFTMARPPNEFFPLEEFRRCANAVLRREGARILQFGSTDGYEPLKRELIEMFRSEGLQRPRRAAADHGRRPAGDRSGVQGVSAAGRFGGAGKSGLSRSDCDSCRARAFGRLPVSVETDPARTGHVGLDVDALEAVLLQNRVKFILVTPDFHNPTGTVLACGRAAAAAGDRGALSGAGDRGRRSTRGCALRGNPMPSLEVAGYVRQRDSDRQLFEDRLSGLARGLVHRPGKRDRAAAPGEAVDRPAHRPAFAGGAGGIHAPRIFDAPSGEDAESVSQPAGGDGGGARKAHAGGNTLDAPGGRHVVCGSRCRRVSMRANC